MSGKRGRPPKKRDLTVESAADLMMRNPDMGLNGALQAHGLTIHDISRAEREAIVVKTITEGYMSDDMRREWVKSARNLALTKAQIDGNMDQIKEWSDAIASEPGVGLTQKQGAEVTLDINILSDAIRVALDQPPPVDLSPYQLIAPTEKDSPHEIPMPDLDPAAPGLEAV